MLISMILHTNDMVKSVTEVGQGSITLRDLRRVAATHDFTWSDQEMADMIHIFDSDRDGKVYITPFLCLASSIAY